MFSAEVAAGINLFDVLAHTHDMAVPAGISVVCPDELWDAALDAARVVIGPDRDLRHYAPDHYAPDVPAGTSASAKPRFLAYLGRSATV